MPTTLRLPPSSAPVERVLARFELACPALREHQVTVEVLAREPTVVILPASGRACGAIELVYTAKGRLRTCVFPPGLSSGQRAAVEDLAWALYEALASPKGRMAPAAPEPVSDATSP